MKYSDVIPKLAKHAEEWPRSSKLQHPSTREIPIISPSQANAALELGAWCFFGGWSLEFGALNQYD
jgi:hypothetical protein